METTSRLSPNKIARFWQICLPMVATVVTVRSYLGVFGIRHVYLGPYLIHHLFTGVLIALPASYWLNFSTAGSRSQIIASILLGIGSGLILDQIVYLVATDATNADYLSNISLIGSAIFLSFGVLSLFISFWMNRGKP